MKRTATHRWANIEALIETHKDELFYAIYRIVLQKETAEELFQETWLHVMERLDSYDTDRPFAPWLFRIARNLCFDYLRSQKRHKQKEHLLLEDDVKPDVDPGVLDQAGLTGILSQAPPIYRDVLHFRYYQDMELKDIAAVVQSPVNTVKSRIKRGLLFLKATLESQP